MLHTKTVDRAFFPSFFLFVIYDKDSPIGRELSKCIEIHHSNRLDSKRKANFFTFITHGEAKKGPRRKRKKRKVIWKGQRSFIRRSANEGSMSSRCIKGYLSSCFQHFVRQRIFFPFETFSKLNIKFRTSMRSSSCMNRRYIEWLVEKRQFQIERRLARNDNLV